VAMAGRQFSQRRFAIELALERPQPCSRLARTCDPHNRQSLTVAEVVVRGATLAERHRTARFSSATSSTSDKACQGRALWQGFPRQIG
jgi:hypothetical protein